MKKTGMLFLAFVVGILGGFTLFQFIVRIVLRQMDAFPVTLIGALSMILPLAGGLAAVMLARRFTNKAGQD
ncbi:hypothetical protein [Paenibacillus lautus]|uniref:hypothetical protein n=1 Tax=Paenibacillus TaxID=44249 RepID=UPI002564F24D|nr:hypothetical protein [Paenibacillus lautus]MDL1164254.1 hypothetical protein [Yersinia pestis]MEC0256973.1 hypothetical protein [Paenibacillus lautus]